MASATDGIETRYVQDVVGLPQVLVETTGGETTLYLYGFSRLAQVQGTDAGWFLGDALGSVRQLVDEDGAVVLARDYDPYGQLLSESGSGASGYGFTREQYDHYTQFIFLRTRWYDSRTGRFSSEDQWPANPDRPDSLNLYAYVWNNPLRYADPSGYQGIVVEDVPSPFVVDITRWPEWVRVPTFAIVSLWGGHYQAHYAETARVTQGWEALLGPWIEGEFRARGIGLEEPRIVVRGPSSLEGIRICLVSTVGPDIGPYREMILPTGDDLYAHHIIQDRWAIQNGIPGYSKADATAIKLSRWRHDAATAVQRAFRAKYGYGTTFQQELELAEAGLRAARVPRADIRMAIGKAMDYFATLGWTH